MNERIKELALEAFQPINSMASEGVADYYTFEQTWFQLYNQKFAELIAKECADLCDRFQARDVGMQPAECAAAIRKMFGVEP